MPIIYVKGAGPFFGDFTQPSPKLSRYLEKAALAGGLAFCPENIYWTRLEPYTGKEDPHQRAIKFAQFLGGAGLDIYLGINLLADDRQGLYTPIPANVPLPHDFSNPLVREGFAGESLDIVDYAQESSGGNVKYLALILEMDFYYYNISEEDYQNLITAVQDAYSLVKPQYPALPVGVYFTLSALWEKYKAPGGQGIYELIVGDDRLNGRVPPTPGMDFLGASAYPLGPEPLFANPSDIDNDYFNLAVNATSKPFHIPELGWPSEDVEFPGGRIIESSPAEQAAFVDYFFALVNAGLPIPLIIWFVLHDIYPAPPELEGFKDMGLWDADILTAKPAWQSWLNY